VRNSLQDSHGNTPPAAAYAALTASSKLQHLDISYCALPAGMWQHMFPTGRQLSDLHSVVVGGVGGGGLPSTVSPAPEGSRLVSGCPGLQSLQMGVLQGSVELLAPLTGLSGLHTLRCNWGDATTEVVQAVCQLTGLREVDVEECERIREEGLLVQLTQLNQLTSLRLWPLLRFWPGRFKGQINLSGEVNTCQ
jgi:hypothetical protein